MNFVRCQTQTGKKTILDRVRFCYNNGLVCWCGLHEGKGLSDFSILRCFFFENKHNFIILNIYTLFFQTSKKKLIKVVAEGIYHHNLHRNNADS